MNNRSNHATLKRAEYLPPDFSAWPCSSSVAYVVVGEDQHRLFKADAVLFPVGAVFRLVPFELHQM